ncbi:hypothetical protein NPIL_78151 [Nephila pilipes]|uniref:Uncharacterized protein n=1 Tax=Nephila pilipes TaxID=299642 RepID=A0A8X6INC5_NEPPI|nr:hypothetical protein NPIL_78151 [Nephila pilipes]
MCSYHQKKALDTLEHSNAVIRHGYKNEFRNQRTGNNEKVGNIDQKGQTMFEQLVKPQYPVLFIVADNLKYDQITLSNVQSSTYS